MALEVVPPWMRALDKQAEDAWFDLRLERSRETFIEAMMQSSGKTRGEVTAIVDEKFPETPRILPAEEPKKEASTFGVCLGLLTLGGSMMVLAGMKLFDIFWRLTR